MNDGVWLTHSPPKGPVLEISSGEGIYLYTKDGRRLLNGFSGLAVTLGLGNSRIIEAITNQVNTLAYSALFRMTHSQGEVLAKRLAGLLPEGLNSVVYTNTGCEAVEAAIRIASEYHRIRGYPEKSGVISLRDSYHGCSIGVAPLSGVYQWPNHEKSCKIVSPNCYRCPFDLERSNCEVFCANSIEDTVEKIGAGNIGALIIEPVLLAGGLIVPPTEYFETVRDVCDRQEILLILDESATAFGRSGSMFALDLLGIDPDIIVLSKGINSGYLPLGVTVAKERIRRLFVDRNQPLIHGSSQSGNPCAIAAALETISILEEEKVPEGIAELTRKVRPVFMELAKNSKVGSVRSFGLMYCIELVKCKKSKEPLPEEDVMDLYAQLLEGGVILHAKKNRLLFLPPLIINEEELLDVFDLMNRMISNL